MQCIFIQDVAVVNRVCSCVSCMITSVFCVCVVIWGEGDSELTKVNWTKTFPEYRHEYKWHVFKDNYSFNQLVMNIAYIV